jgi:2OG-Fe(II) oxygenase superfamily
MGQGEASRMGVTSDLPIASIVDLDRYPILDPGNPALRGLVEKARDAFAEQGAFLAPGFVRPDALRAMLAEIDALQPHARYHHRTQPAGERQDNYGTYELQERYVQRYATLTYDRFGPGSLLRRLYECDGLTALVGSVFGEPSYYRSTDPVLACLAHIAKDGDGLSWHFDPNDGVVTLLLQRPEAGGVLEVAPWIRRGGEEGRAIVRSVVDGQYEGIVRIDPEPGTLVFFRGHRSLHRVTPVEGSKARINLVCSYSSEAGHTFSESHRRAYA